LAIAGDSEGLKALQDELNARPKGIDNLAAISGIGERTAEVLQAAGITTFAALAAMSPDRLAAISDGAGLRAGNYDAWIGEAKLRAAGVRVRSSHRQPTERVRCPQDLSAVAGIGPVFEERLYKAGIGSYWEVAEMRNSDLAAVLGEPADYDAIRASALQQATESNSVGRTWDGTPPDDFEVLAGIGEIYEKRLYEAGICTYEALAATPKERLAEICAAPKGRAPDYDEWIAEAYRRAAARGTGEQ
jgi:predicted flap endonuclease-1-like 5' DNA nuclease